MVNTWKIILATVVIFGAGVVTGGLLVNHAKTAKVRPAWGRPPVTQPAQLIPPPRDVPRRPEHELQRSIEQRRIEFLLRATRELNLTPAQRERVEQLVGESQERARRVLEEVRPQMRKELADVTERLRQELTPPQRKRFDELMKRQQVRRVEEPMPAPPPPTRSPREGRHPASPPENSPKTGQR